MAEFPIDQVRVAFPALRDGFIFFDNAAGAQSPSTVLDAVAYHLRYRNVQRGGRYRQSQEVDEAIARARSSVALLVNARSAEEICFGMNATSFMRLVSLAIGQSLKDRREIIVTDLDHEANIAVWLALEREGARILWWHFRDDGRLHPEDLEKLLSARTRIVACTLASNAIGSILDVAEVSRLAHAAGAEVFVDAVHYGPHGPIDVQAFGCDYLVCSGYKIFSPHMGFLWGRRETLDALPTFREEFVPDTTPAKLEIGTYIYENVAGMDAAVSYLEYLGRIITPAATSRRAALVTCAEAIRSYEMQLSSAMLDALAAVNATVYGITAKDQISHRTPTLCFNLPGISPAKVTEALASKNIAVRDGHMYSPRLMKRLGLSQESGAVRASLVHYNTLEEVRTFGNLLAEIH
ncbi:MAG: cysteine desulfurase family protein, subfamily [Candidatus Angelobacter sp.]|nr:cysteine desulfurase family protein, subfamily [Candidatus Angelobacter sp.]